MYCLVKKTVQEIADLKTKLLTLRISEKTRYLAHSYITFFTPEVVEAQKWQSDFKPNINFYFVQ